MPTQYKVDYDEELDLYTVRNTQNGHRYDIRRNKKDGTFEHTCKAILVYGDDFMCEHKIKVIEKYFIKDEKVRKMFRESKRKNRFVY